MAANSHKAYLRLNGINAREHPVMRELERVKQYVKKINDAQSGNTEAKRETALNKEVVARFVKHDLVIPPFIPSIDHPRPSH